jgi:hypothetical protein
LFHILTLISLLISFCVSVVQSAIPFPKVTSAS